jgi:cytochrome b6-f complex iron-sulfur subunit
MLTLILGAWGTGILGAVVYPIARFLIPPEVPESTTLSVSGGAAASLKPNSSRLVPFGAKPAIVVRQASGELKALSATCTHLSCTVQYRPDLKEVWCACHNGHYDLTGRNVAGPPPRPLTSFSVDTKDDEIIISRNA